MKIRHCALSLVGKQRSDIHRLKKCMQITCYPAVKALFNLSERLIVCCVVGEPIMYPRINELVRILHGHEISSFLVTNAQFPDAIRWVFWRDL